VISPPKTESVLTVLEAAARAFAFTPVEAEAVSDPVVRIVPSLGYANPDAKPTVSFGAETEVEIAPSWPGMTILIP
jgi:hypothetical protein